jgi:hypothetical protein
MYCKYCHDRIIYDGIGWVLGAGGPWTFLCSCHLQQDESSSDFGPHAPLILKREVAKARTELRSILRMIQ